jgi:molybdate transport system substrate-binding protein
MRAPAGVVALAAGLALLAGCGDSGTVAAGAAKPRLVVSAASSLKEALTACSRDFADADVKLQFAGSDALAAQIRQGAPVDVFASADTALPEQLAKAGELEQPVTFASNTLVLAVPADGGDVTGLGDLARPGTRIAIGAEGVPVGDYTRKALAQLGPARSKAILANVRSNEPDVKGIVGKLTQGAVDAGFVYASDVDAAGGALKAIELPPGLDTKATYGAGVVKGSDQPDAAESYVDDLLSGPCHKALADAGFGEP